MPSMSQQSNTTSPSSQMIFDCFDRFEASLEGIKTAWEELSGSQPSGADLNFDTFWPIASKVVKDSLPKYKALQSQLETRALIDRLKESEPYPIGPSAELDSKMTQFIEETILASCTAREKVEAYLNSIVTGTVPPPIVAHLLQETRNSTIDLWSTYSHLLGTNGRKIKVLMT